MDVEDLRQAGDPEDLQDALLRADQVQRALLGAHPLEPADEHAEAGGVEELDALHVHDEMVVPSGHEAVELVAAGNYDIVIDLERVEFLDSTGLGVLVGGLKKVRAHDGSLQLVCNQDRLLKIFRITGLAKVFTIHASADAALT